MPYAMENDNVIRLIRITIEELKRRMVIPPGITTLERIVNKVRQTADETVITIINESLTDAQKHGLNELVESPNETFRTTLAYLKEDPGQSSPRAFMGVIDRLEVIRKIGLNLNIESIHPNRVKQLSRLGSKYEPHTFRRFEESKRYAILALYLYDLSQSLIDLAVEIHDKQINILLSKGRKKQEEIQKQNGKTLNEKVIQFVEIGSALIKAKNEGLDPFITVETVMPWDKIIESVEEAKKIARPVNYDYLDLLNNRYNYLRKYTPALVKYLEFSSTNRSLEPLIDALKIINDMNEMGKKKVPDDAIKRVQATLVNYQHKQFLSSYWGDGSTSSSDGMRVQVGVSSLHAEHNPHYGAEKGTTIYRFVSDHFSAFYTKIINTNARDAVHVIDGLLYHETELCIDEHYTDTAGYTDQVFGLCHLLGFRFAPRIRDISELKLYSFTKPSDYPKIENIIQGKINTKIIRENYDDVLRLAYSIREDNVSGSLIMSKLGSYARQNALATALREMGRIEKTIFILDYISNESLRRRIQRGLNKGEAVNALARAIFFGKRGELRERELQSQLQRASALNILINTISVWNTTYLQKAIDYLKSAGDFNDELLKHIAPLGWEHINFLGEYSFDMRNVPEAEKLRPLNIGN
jgi:TnpA family transposase